jgi:hypothetical protein
VSAVEQGGATATRPGYATCFRIDGRIHPALARTAKGRPLGSSSPSGLAVAVSNGELGGELAWGVEVVMVMRFRSAMSPYPLCPRGQGARASDVEEIAVVVVYLEILHPPIVESSALLRINASMV